MSVPLHGLLDSLWSLRCRAYASLHVLKWHDVIRVDPISFDGTYQNVQVPKSQLERSGDFMPAA
jgi:hypothetical protein